MSASQQTTATAPRLARTPLHELHLSLGARMVDFAGYALPVQFPSGIINEHLFTRAKAGLFDVSHMGQAILSGQGAARRLETLVPADVAGLAVGRMRYTLLLNADGHIRDDMMVTRLAGDEHGRERLLLVVNAATKKADFAYICAGLADCTLTILEERALIALQGPAAAAALCRQLPQEAKAVASMPFLSANAFEWDGAPVHISRSGYTGEDGFEISLPAAAAQAFAQKLLDDEDVRPAGLGARDSLRLEAGLCLYGHDIDETTDPVEAGLLWTIPSKRRESGGFAGALEIKRAIANGPSRRRVGLLLEGKIPAREGAMIKTGEGRTVGHVTSGGFAPSLRRPIAMGYVEAGCAAPSTPLLLSVREKELAAHIVPMPFVPHHYYRGAS